MAPATADLSPIWQSFPVELVQRVLHEFVTPHLSNIDSDPFYPWMNLRQLNHQQRRRIDAVYRQLLLPMLYLYRDVEFCPASNRPEITHIRKGRFHRRWVGNKDEGYDSTNGTITLCLTRSSCYLHMEDGHDMHHDMHPNFDASKGWNKYVNSFPPGGLYVNPDPYYRFGLKLIYKSRWHSGDGITCLEGKIPASYVPDVQDDSDDDSIKVSWSQLIGAVIRAWKKRVIRDARMDNQWYIPRERLEDLDVPIV